MMGEEGGGGGKTIVCGGGGNKGRHVREERPFVRPHCYRGFDCLGNYHLVRPQHFWDS